MRTISPGDETARDRLPPLPPGHGLQVGDAIEQPVYGCGMVRGTVEYIDVISPRGDRFRGLVMLADNGRYYELHCDLVRKI